MNLKGCIKCLNNNETLIWNVWQRGMSSFCLSNCFVCISKVSSWQCYGLFNMLTSLVHIRNVSRASMPYFLLSLECEHSISIFAHVMKTFAEYLRMTCHVSSLRHLFYTCNSTGLDNGDIFYFIYLILLSEHVSVHEPSIRMNVLLRFETQF